MAPKQQSIFSMHHEKQASWLLLCPRPGSPYLVLPTPTESQAQEFMFVVACVIEYP